MIEQLIQFAKQNHPGFEGMTDATVRNLFETYKNTTLIYRVGDQVKGFAIYQEWPELLNFICICGAGTRIQNLRAMLNGRKRLPHKKVVFYDETKHRLIELCLQQQ